MLLRIWKVKVRSGRFAELERFVENDSLPMFQRQVGCLGALFTRHGDLCAVLSFWSDRAAIVALHDSPTYQQTVAKLTAAALLDGDATVELFECFAGMLDLAALMRAVAQC